MSFPDFGLGTVIPASSQPATRGPSANASGGGVNWKNVAKGPLGIAAGVAAVTGGVAVVYMRRKKKKRTKHQSPEGRAYRAR